MISNLEVALCTHMFDLFFPPFVPSPVVLRLPLPFLVKGRFGGLVAFSCGFFLFFIAGMPACFVYTWLFAMDGREEYIRTRSRYRGTSTTYFMKAATVCACI